MKKHFNIPRFVALLLIIALIIPVNASAAVPETAEPYASNYISSCSAYVEPLSGGKIRVNYSIFGIETLDTIGALTITISQSSDNVNFSVYKTYSYTSNSGMLSYNTNCHSGYVECQGVPGRYYNACVTFYGGKDDSSTTRYYYTTSKRAVTTVS